jgi:hypothetical protein
MRPPPDALGENPIEEWSQDEVFKIDLASGSRFSSAEIFFGPGAWKTRWSPPVLLRTGHR